MLSQSIGQLVGSSETLDALAFGTRAAFSENAVIRPSGGQIWPMLIVRADKRERKSVGVSDGIDIGTDLGLKLSMWL
jgi:hypothetical protein